MSVSKSVGGDEMKKAAYGAYCLLRDNLPNSFKFTESEEDNFIITALRQHGLHLSTHAIDQDNVDPIKLLCWVGSAIIGTINDPTYKLQGEVLTAIINSLEETIILETSFILRLTSPDFNLIHRMAMEEIKGNGKHGVGFNGLFLTFHALRVSYDAVIIAQRFGTVGG
jgi:hypothetical protein